MKNETKVTPAIAAEIFRRHFGKKIKSPGRIHGGLANHVFQARLGSEELVLRISEHPSKLQVFMKEQWAVAAARKKHIPTPEILEVRNDDFSGLPYMILRKVSGLSAVSLGEKHLAVLHDLGRLTAKINSIETHDFGDIFDWSPNKLSRKRTWQQYLDEELKVEERLAILGSSGLLKPPDLKKMRAQIAQMRAWKAKPSLSHGDIRLKNVIVNERGRIVAILDWEECTSNIAPYWELSLALHDLSMDEKQSFLEGYGMDLRDYMEKAPAIKTLNVLNYSRSVRHSLKRNDQAKLLNFRARLSGAFDLYSL